MELAWTEKSCEIGQRLVALVVLRPILLAQANRANKSNAETTWIN